MVIIPFLTNIEGVVRGGGVIDVTPTITCYALAIYRPIYSYFPAFRALLFLYNILIYTYIISIAPLGLNIVVMP